MNIVLPFLTTLLLGLASWTSAVPTAKATVPAATAACTDCDDCGAICRWLCRLVCGECERPTPPPSPCCAPPCCRGK